MAFVISSIAVRRSYRERPEDTLLADFDRRVLWVDGGEPELNTTAPEERLDFPALDTTDPIDLIDFPELNESEPDANTTRAEIKAENLAIRTAWREKNSDIRAKNAAVRAKNAATMAKWRQDNAAIKVRNEAIKAENSAIKETFKENLFEVGEVALEEHERVELFDGKIFSEAPYQYNKHYFLGDKVSLLAEYDFDQTMRVIEYVRTEDVEGDRGYPGLEVTF